ncbi:helix-turn-helix domain-containing protein [Nocardiopsis metallicus]|uniref:Transcriptional regulator with XRE-family HTH domain n=1 Tax=Nocardiopsis metallicus TaxID=179819 RepID=A0A840W4N4_9ACTN|nr:helix-turn-helix transcriptional regulator [Nocardiopsis metallicus]MBB5490954.1 transcriptional regulator with XRE-family HTH domain [Nocardiopsis metallicus]
MTEQEFGPYLARERKRAGYTLRRLAKEAGTSASTLSRWENNHAVPVRDDALKLDGALGLKGTLFRKWETYTSPSALLPWMLDAGKLEEAATSVTYVSPVLVPGLLQSPGYAEMIFAEGQPLWSPSEVARVVALRSKRYEYLRERNNPKITAVFPAVALSMVPDAVRREQVERLVSLMDDGVRVHVIPLPGVPMGVTSPLLLVRLEDGTRAASSDHQNGNVVFDASSGLERLFEIERRVLSDALPLEQSRQLLKEMI